MRSPDFYSGLLWFLVGAYIAYDGYGMGLGRLSEPGSGFILFWVGAAMMAMSGTVSVTGFLKQRDKTIDGLFQGVKWTKVVLLLIIMTVYVTVLEPVGFLPATVVLLVVLFRTVDPLTWPGAIFAAAVTTTIVYVVFGIGLGTQFPRGNPDTGWYYGVPGLLFALALMFRAKLLPSRAER